MNKMHDMFDNNKKKKMVSFERVCTVCTADYNIISQREFYIPILYERRDDDGVARARLRCFKMVIFFSTNNRCEIRLIEIVFVCVQPNTKMFSLKKKIIQRTKIHLTKIY